MLMILLYFIAVMLETGVGVWIFGKMFPKRKEYSKYRIAEKIVFFFIVLFTYTMLKGYLGIESNIKYFIAIYIIVVSLDCIAMKTDFISRHRAKYFEIKEIILFLLISALLTIQYWNSYLSGMELLTGNSYMPFFLLAFYNCKFFQAYLWEVIYLVNIGFLKILYILTAGLLTHRTMREYLYSGINLTNSYQGALWIVIISILMYVLQKILNVDVWMGKLLKKNLTIIWIVSVIECGILYLFFYFCNGIIEEKALIIGFMVITAIMLVLMLIAIHYYIKNIDTEKNLLEVRNNMMASQYQQLNEHYREYRCLVHDEKYMINFIEESLKSGDLEEIQQLLCRCKEKFVRKDYWTGISIVDRVITMEKRKMDELDIDFCLNAEVMDIIVDDMDFIILFENLINNAIEAASKCKEKRKIELTMKNVNDTLIFKLRNSNSKLPNRKGKKFLTDKMDTAGHGWGIESVKHIVEKYNGSVDFSYDESFFDVLIIIER